MVPVVVPVRGVDPLVTPDEVLPVVGDPLVLAVVSPPLVFPELVVPELVLPLVDPVGVPLVLGAPVVRFPGDWPVVDEVLELRFEAAITPKTGSSPMMPDPPVYIPPGGIVLTVNVGGVGEGVNSDPEGLLGVPTNGGEGTKPACFGTVLTEIGGAGPRAWFDFGCTGRRPVWTWL